MILILFLSCYKITVYAQTEAENNDIAFIYSLYREKNAPAISTENKVKEGFYKKFISRQISASCEYKQTCSQFMKEAQAEFGLLKGFLLGIDRLSRCGASSGTYTALPALIENNDYLLTEDLNCYD